MSNTSYSNNDNFQQQVNVDLIKALEKYSESDLEIQENLDLLKRLCTIKHKDILRETLQEYQRRGNFIRIYPAKGTDCYDVYYA